MLHLGTWFSWWSWQCWVGLMILEVISNLSDYVIVTAGYHHFIHISDNNIQYLHFSSSSIKQIRLFLTINIISLLGSNVIFHYLAPFLTKHLPRLLQKITQALLYFSCYTGKQIDTVL